MLINLFKVANLKFRTIKIRKSCFIFICCEIVFLFEISVKSGSNVQRV